MPFYFMEIACLLFEGCKDCFGTEYIQVGESRLSSLSKLPHIKPTVTSRYLSMHLEP
jgi:hypothetical protein